MNQTPTLETILKAAYWDGRNPQSARIDLQGDRVILTLDPCSVIDEPKRFAVTGNTVSPESTR